MSIRIVRLGTPRHPDEGPRIGTVRRPPRGVPKAEFASRDFYDVWFPNLSPSPELVKLALASQADLSAVHSRLSGGDGAPRERPCNRAAGDAVSGIELLGGLLLRERGALPSLGPARAA